MYEVPDMQDYRQKWLEAERELAINWVELQKDSERVKEPLLTPKAPE